MLDHGDGRYTVRYTAAISGRYAVAVGLEGRGPTLLDAAVRRGLQTASGRVTKLVREGKRLRSLRPYLTL